MTDPLFVISSYKSRYDRGKKLSVKRLSWDALAKRLSNFKVVECTREDYESRPAQEKMDLKDTGYWVGGLFDPPYRKSDNLKSRGLIALDIDYAETWDIDGIREAYKGLSYILHSSISHTDDKPRLRIVFPMMKDITPEQYEPIGRWLAARAGMDLFDATTFQPSRIMFRPARFKDQPSLFERHKGEWVHPDEILGDEYEDWQDIGEWPRTSMEEERGIVRAYGEKAQDPLQIPGFVGAFCRVYDVESAILEFELPYAPSDRSEGRYIYLGSGGEDGRNHTDGGVVYDDGLRFHSFHHTDPASGQHNAWDLVRLHRFAHLDEGLPASTPVNELPSDKAMKELAETIPAVLDELGDVQRSRVVDPETEFEEVEVDEDGQKTTVARSAHLLSYDELLVLVSAHATFPDRESWRKVLSRIAIAWQRGRVTDDDVSALVKSLRHRHFSGNAVDSAALIKTIRNIRDAKGRAGVDADGAPKDIQESFLRHFESERYHDGVWLRRAGETFWEYTGTHWRPADSEVIAGYLQETLLELIEDPSTDKKDRQRLQDAAGGKELSTIWTQLKSMFAARKAAHTARRAIETGGDPQDPMGLLRLNLTPGINCLDGEIEFNEAGQFRLTPHRPDSLYMHVIDAHLDKTGDCPLWDQFCADAFQYCLDPEGMQRHLEEFCGYILNRSRKMRVWAMFYGPTGSGKSTTAAILDSLMGDATKVMSLDNYDGRNSHALAGLVGKYLLIDDDVKDGTTLNDQFIKTTSEERALTANPKNKNEVKFISRIVTLLCSNNPPATKDISGALYARALVFPFGHTVPQHEQDPYLVKKILTTERGALLYRFTRGLSRLVKRGMNWDLPVDAEIAFEDWKHDSNPIPRFLDETVEVHPGGVLSSSETWKLFETYVATESLYFKPQRNSFYRKLESHFGVPRLRKINRRGVSSGWRGLRLRHPEEAGDRRERSRRRRGDSDFD